MNYNFFDSSFLTLHQKLNISDEKDDIKMIKSLYDSYKINFRDMMWDGEEHPEYVRYINLITSEYYLYFTKQNYWKKEEKKELDLDLSKV